MVSWRIVENRIRLPPASSQCVQWHRTICSRGPAFRPRAECVRCNEFQTDAVWVASRQTAPSATANLDPLANCSVKSRYIIFIKFSTAKTFQQQFIITEKQTQQTPSYTPEPERVDFVLFFFFLLAASVHSIAECAAYHNVYQFMRCWSSRTTGQPFQNGLRPKKVCRLSSWSHRQTGI